MSQQNNIKELMKGHTLVPVVTFENLNETDRFVEFLLAQNVRCIEITLRTEAGIKAIEHIKKKYGNQMLTGAGTVTNVERVTQVKNAGGDFIVSPGLTDSLAHALIDSNIAFLPGVCTASEIMQAEEYGFDALKFFPADLFGGIKAVKTFGSVFPSVQFCPTGGVSKETSDDFLALPNVFAVGGSWFQKDFNL